MARTMKVQVTETRTYEIEVHIPDNCRMDDEEAALQLFGDMQDDRRKLDELGDTDSVIVTILDRGREEQDPDDARDEMIERRRLDDLDRGSNRYSALDAGDYD